MVWKVLNWFVRAQFWDDQIGSLFISKTVICLVYADDCTFWERSQYDIDNVMKSFEEEGPSHNCEYTKEESVSEFLGIDIKTFDDGGF